MAEPVCAIRIETLEELLGAIGDAFAEHQRAVREASKPLGNGRSMRIGCAHAEATSTVEPGGFELYVLSNGEIEVRVGAWERAYLEGIRKEVARLGRATPKRSKGRSRR